MHLARFSRQLSCSLSLHPRSCMVAGWDQLDLGRRAFRLDLHTETSKRNNRNTERCGATSGLGESINRTPRVAICRIGRCIAANRSRKEPAGIHSCTKDPYRVRSLRQSTTVALHSASVAYAYMDFILYCGASISVSIGTRRVVGQCCWRMCSFCADQTE